MSINCICGIDILWYFIPIDVTSFWIFSKKCYVKRWSFVVFVKTSISTQICKGYSSVEFAKFKWGIKKMKKMFFKLINWENKTIGTQKIPITQKIAIFSVELFGFSKYLKFSCLKEIIHFAWIVLFELLPYLLMKIVVSLAHLCIRQCPLKNHEILFMIENASFF